MTCLVTIFGNEVTLDSISRTSEILPCSALFAVVEKEVDDIEHGKLALSDEELRSSVGFERFR